MEHRSVALPVLHSDEKCYILRSMVEWVLLNVVVSRTGEPEFSSPAYHYIQQRGRTVRSKSWVLKGLARKP